MASVSTTADLGAAGISARMDFPSAAPPDYATRLRRARLGLLVALTPVLMLFVSFTSAYVVRQGLPTLDPRTNQLVRDWIPVKLPGLLLLNTVVLLLSSVGMELARRQTTKMAAAEANSTQAGSVVARGEAPRPFPGASAAEKMPWLAITIALGLLFLFGQWVAWKQLGASGFYVATTPSSSFVYLLTGAHAVHLMGGVLALLVAGAFALLRRAATTQSIVVDVAAWYWHFMAALWVYIFSLLEFAR